MAANVPAKLKDADIVRFAQRAAQLEKVKPIISYWLRFYITQKIISQSLHLADDECRSYTTNLLQQLEGTKAVHPDEDALLDEVAAHAYCEQFALDIFAKADNVMRANKVTVQTADTFKAAGTFLDLLSVWKNPPEPEIAGKAKYAKFHALRIAKALRVGEDPNLSNPVQETPPGETSPAPLDPNDPEVRQIAGSPAPSQPPGPYQPYAESVHDHSGPPSPTFPGARIPPSANIPSAPAGYTPASQFYPHRDVSPISSVKSRKGSAGSVGGGYFPRVPTFTEDNAAPSLPTAPSTADDPMTTPFGNGAPQPSSVSDAQNFYQHQPSPAPQSHFPPTQPESNASQYTPQPLSQVLHQIPPSQPFQPPPAPAHPHYQYPPQQLPPVASPPPQQAFPQPMTGVTHTQQASFRTDEEAIMAAQKHAKWAISALNFEDVDTAVKELRVALNALGAR